MSEAADAKFDPVAKFNEILALWEQNRPWDDHDWRNFTGFRGINNPDFGPMTIDQKTQVLQALIDRFPSAALQRRKEIYDMLRQSPKGEVEKIVQRQHAEYLRESQSFSWPLFIDANFSDGLKLQPLAEKHNIFPDHKFEK